MHKKPASPLFHAHWFGLTAGVGFSRHSMTRPRDEDSRVYSWPLDSGWIPVDFWQYVFSTHLLSRGGTNRGVWPVACRWAWRPSRMPSVAAMGRARKPTLTSQRNMAAAGREALERLAKGVAGCKDGWPLAVGSRRRASGSERRGARRATCWTRLVRRYVWLVGEDKGNASRAWTVVDGVKSDGRVLTCVGEGSVGRARYRPSV